MSRTWIPPRWFTPRWNVGGFIGPGRGVDKIDEIFLFCRMCDVAERGVQLRQEAVRSDHGGVFSDRGGGTWSPGCSRSFAQIVPLISGALTPSAGVSTEG